MGRKRRSKVGKYTIKQLFETYVFNVPEYQRCYSWGEKERKVLFGDINDNLRDEEDIFMSTIVLLFKKEREINGKKYRFVDLVDGQQRITTLAILLKTIWILKQELGERDKTIEDLLIKKGSGVTYNVISQGNHKSSTLLSNYIKTGDMKSPATINTIAQKNLKDAFNECYQFIKYSDYYAKNPCQERDASTINKIKSIVLNNYQLISYELPEENSVYKTFESLNGKGLPVSAIDNFKSRLMGIAFSEADEEAINELHKIWTEIYSTIGMEKINEDDTISISATLFKSLDDNKTRPKTVAEAMDYFYSVAFKSIDDEHVPPVLKHEDPDLDTKGYRCQKISEIIQRTAAEMVSIHKDKRIDAITDVKQARILLIAIRLSDYSDDDKAELLKEWEKTTFRLFCLHRKDARSFVGEYINCAEKVIKYAPISNVESLIRQIGSKFSFDDGIKAVEGGKWYPDYNNDVVYIMRRYDEYLAHEKGEELSDTTWGIIWENDPSTTIEHIFPKTYPKNETEVSSFKADWAHGRGIRYSQEKMDGFVHNIGNLTILPPGVNAKAGQKAYPEKIKLYGSKMHIHPDIHSKYLKSGFWTEKSIKEREQDILEFIKNTWK